MKIYNKESGDRYFLEVEEQYLEKLHELPFLAERMKIKKFEKLVAHLHNKTIYAIYMLKQTLDNGLILKKFMK